MVEGASTSLTCFHVETPETVKERQPAVLTCSTTCSLTDPTFIWYKNGQLLTNITNNQLHLQPVSSEDAGSYSCAVRGYEHLRSADQTLRVRYPPKSVSVSMPHPGDIVEGSSVTLTCSNDANPPADEYLWFRDKQPVGKGKDYPMTKISFQDEGEYKCRSGNAEGLQYSAGVTLILIGPPKKVLVSMPPPGDIVEGSSVTLTCSSDANPPADEYSWFRDKELAGKGKDYTISNISSQDEGEYKCKSRNTKGQQYSAGVALILIGPPKKVVVSIRPIDEIVEGSSVTLTCSSDANPPVKIYTWFKGSTPVGNGDTYNIPNIRSEHSGEYTCQSRNDHGEGRSTAVQINVLYPPKKVSVSISGEIVEGSSVNLTCNGDGNPPVKTYTWFKEGGASPVRSGPSYSITNITAEHTGLYYCEARNELGRQMASAALSLYPEHSYTAVLVTVGLSLQNVPPAAGGLASPDCSSKCSDELQALPLFPVKISSHSFAQKALSKTRDGDNTVPTMNAAAKDIRVGRSALDNTYVRPADEPHSLDALYANVPDDSADDTYMTYDEDGYHDYSKMFLQVSLLQLLLFELTVIGTFGEDWSVTYTRQKICALNGSTVVMFASYRHPSHLKVLGKFWAINPTKDGPLPDLTKDPGYSGRAQYSEGQNQLFSLRVRNVTEKDEHLYCLRITTDTTGQQYLGYPGVRLRVTGLWVEYPERVVEKNTTLLTCKTNCTLTSKPKYIWYKNGHRINRSDEDTNTLLLQPTRIEDSGRYSCAVKGSEHLPSPAVSLSVRYPPKNVSVSISAIGEIVEGSSVNLSCSGDANPPVDEYHWFRGKQLVGKGKDYTISNYSSETAGEYKCKSSNAEGHQYSMGVTVKVTDESSNVPNVVIGVIVLCTVICFAVIMVFLRSGPLLARIQESCLLLADVWCTCDPYLATVSGPPKCHQSMHQMGQMEMGNVGQIWENLNSNTAVPTHGAPQSNAGPINQDENQYDSIVHCTDATATQASASGAAEEVQYASVQYTHVKGVKKPKEENVDVQYASVSYKRSPRLLLRASLEIVGMLVLAVLGSLGQNWSVTHTPSKICAFHHTSLALPCKFTYPKNQTVSTSTWHYRKSVGATPVAVSGAQDFGEYGENCSLTLNNLTQDSAGIYQFSFTTNTSTQTLTNQHGVTLEVTDLEVELVSQSDVVIEGEWVILTCGTCIPSVTVPTYIWHKDGRLHTQRRGYNQLELLQVKPEDTGSYSCSIKDHEDLLSSAVHFTVQWPPKNVSVSISPSGEIVEGSSVNLTCSSDANPPVKIYTWFKGSTPVGNGDTYNIPNIRSEHSGGYTCQSRNEHGERRSTAVQINVSYPPKKVSVSIPGHTVEGSSVTLTCSSDGNPPVKNYTWFKEGGASPVETGHSYNITSITAEHTGLYYCVAQNEHGAQNGSVVVTVKRRSMVLYVAVGVAVVGVAALLGIALCIRSKKQTQNRQTDSHDCQKADPVASDDTYTALALKTRSPDNVYGTIENVHPGPPADTCSPGHSDYENV
ncbi:hypothetical protein NFI96_022544, partial [Prochilodus magdalenae]